MGLAYKLTYWQDFESSVYRVIILYAESCCSSQRLFSMVASSTVIAAISVCRESVVVFYFYVSFDTQIFTHWKVLVQCIAGSVRS